MLNKTALGPVTQAGAERKILSVEKPQTQTVEAVKALLSWRGRASDPLPEFVEMGEGDSRLVLVLSNKKDCFYVVTSNDCSCPAHNWHPGQRCKHQRKHFAEQAIHKQSIEETLREADKNLPRMPYQYQRMVRAAREEAEAEPLELGGDHKPFRPFIEDDGKPTRAAEVA